MGLFYRAGPSYRGHQPAQAQSGTGGLSGFWCGLFGGSPVYKQAGRANEAAIAPRCWWQLFPATPQYKTADEDDEGCVPETPPPECPDDEPEVYLADDGTLVW